MDCKSVKRISLKWAFEDASYKVSAYNATKVN